MTSKYAAEAAGAYADVKDAGAAVTFTRTVPGTYDASTDTFTAPSTSTITGYALQVAGDPDVYRALSLVESSCPTLLFAPLPIDGTPKVGDTVVWGGTTFTARAVKVLAPDTTTILARVVAGV